MTTSTRDLVPPARAVRVDAWRDDGDGLVRYFTGSSWVIESDRADVTIAIAGFQHADGRSVRHVVIDSEEGGTTTVSIGQGRQLARALIAATDESDRMQAADDDRQP